DPKDPTPWFYDAIHKQTTNRPVEALHDLQKAIELNDNRAVYRSKLLLDEDLAARSASLGRIYNDLGFQQLGLVEGWKSVNTDPSNFSAHRLLADNYAALPRHEIARVSELLQSQLLQPINITPVQPNLAQSNLLILEGGGPSALSFNEFNPLFTRNRLALQAAGVLGDHDTLGDEVTQSGLWDKFSYSLGQFHFQTDGFQENNDLQHDIYSAFGQWTATWETSVQVELRRRETESGKVALTFDPLDPDFRQELEQNSARAGLHLQPALNQNTLLSFAYQSTDIMTSDLTPFDPPFESDFGRERTEDKIEAYHFELQHLYKTRSFNAIAGMGYVDGDFERAVLRDLIINGQAVVPEGRPLVRVDDTVDTSHLNGYVYLPFRLIPNMLVTLGLSYDDIEDVDINTSQINPKFGLIWNAFTNTTLRAAAFRAMKRQFGSNQTIEPTQVAGFNQFFDESDGTDSTRYGVGVDHRLTDSLATGLELSWRKVDFVRLLEPDLAVPRSLAEFDAIEHEQDETFHRAYAYWTPIGSLALGVEYQYESFDRKEIGFAVGDPDELITHYVPLTVKYFHPSGFFAAFGATYIDQGLEFDIFGEGGKVGERSEGDNFWVLDSSVGFRLPKRYGLLTLEMRNLTDEDFRFQSFFNSEETRTPRFQPERAIFATLNLWFR
ncbi:MAG: TonB-dependent receptor, partial [Nitrososphaera sp.]|nr:TonB-dependent receptor [Nitrososphaera sp.]